MRFKNLKLIVRGAVLSLALTVTSVVLGQNTYTLTSGGSWVVPQGVYAIKVECIGGGGGGGRSEGSGQATGGGGGGAYASGVICVQPYQNVSYSVGVGGAGGASGNNGGNTWFGGTSSAPGVKAEGGKGGVMNSETGAQGGSAANSIGVVKYNGGKGGNGSGDGCSHGSGGGGSAAGTNGNGNNGGNGTTGLTSGNGGAGGTYRSTYGGAGGNGAGSDGVGGSAPYGDNNYGGGGGGGKRGCASAYKRDGGSGANGVIIITVLIKNPSAGEDVSVCPGMPVQLNGTLEFAAGANTTMLWSGGPIMVGESTLHPTINPTEPTNYVFTATHGVCSVSDTVFVDILPAPALTLPEMAVLCPSQNVTLESGYNGEEYSVLWSDGSTESNLVVTQQGNYSVTVTANNGCESSQSVQVLSSPAPNAGTISANDLGGGTYLFVSNGAVGTSYLWNFGDGSTSTQASPTHTYSAVGTYNVSLKITNLCGDNTKNISVVVDEVSGIEELAIQNVVIYPNPARDFVTFSNDNAIPFNAISVYNLMGQEMQVVEFNGETSYQMDLTSFAKGLYVVKIILENGAVIQKKFEVIR